MTFSNPAGDAVAAAPGYGALLELLGLGASRSTCSRAAPWLDARLAGVPEERLRGRRRRASGAWSRSSSTWPTWR
jgi:hypothetical protein